MRPSMSFLHIMSLRGRVLRFAVLSLLALACSAPPSSHERMLRREERTTGGVIFHLDDGQRFRIRFERTPYTKRNLLLFYVGKRVWLADRDPDGCFHLTPIKQETMPTLTEEQYDLMIGLGFTDQDIEYSFRVPAKHSNPNPSPPTYGGLVSYGAPGVCGEKL
jgi:hypothetical protein